MPSLSVRARATRVALAVIGAAAVPLTLSAQAAARGGAPDAGTWGVEASAGTGQSGSLLRFFSPRWAVVGSLGVSSFTREFLGDTDRSTFTTLRVGARQYARTGLGVRPIVGFGLTLVDGFGPESGVGAYGELGAAYFFNPHVSLGGSGQLSVTRQDGGGTNLSLGIARLTGAVYF